MSKNRLIYVVGTPSGGTSAVAGALHHLGVNMGRFPIRPGVRGYTTYEDTQADPYKQTPAGPGEIVERQRLRLREYIRMRQQQGGGRIGLKGSALWWLTEEEPEELPIDVVRVKRPLEHSIESDARIQAKMAKTVPNWPAWSLERRLDRAAALARTWSGGETLCRIVPPKVLIHYADLTAHPKREIGRLISGLRLSPDEKQVRAAVRFIDPKKRHF